MKVSYIRKAICSAYAIPARLSFALLGGYIANK